MSTSPTNPPEHAVTETDETVTHAQIIVPFPDSFVYSNVTALSASFMDIRIGFAEAMPDGTAQPRVGIVMPAEHAAQLAMNLLRNLAFFERNFGEIRNPQWRAFHTKAKASAEAVTKTPKDSTDKTNG